eukprot:12071940-Alexandrium_andersonii.AAC.1
MVDHARGDLGWHLGLQHQPPLNAQSRRQAKRNDRRRCLPPSGTPQLMNMLGTCIQRAQRARSAFVQLLRAQRKAEWHRRQFS